MHSMGMKMTQCLWYRKFLQFHLTPFCTGFTSLPSSSSTGNRYRWKKSKLSVYGTPLVWLICGFLVDWLSLDYLLDLSGMQVDGIAAGTSASVSFHTAVSGLNHAWHRNIHWWLCEYWFLNKGCRYGQIPPWKKHYLNRWYSCRNDKATP